MRLFFPPQLRVGVQGVAGPLPGVVQLVQLAADGVVGGSQPRPALDLFLEQGHRPGRVRVAEILGRAAEQAGEQALGVLAQQRGPPWPIRVGQGDRVERIGVGGDPVGDALASHAEHGGDVGGRAAPVELQDGQRAAVEAGVGGLGQLPPQAPSLVIGQS
jgi:hypothetical protein